MKLVPIDERVAEALRPGNTELWERYGVRVAGDAPLIREAVDQTIRMLTGRPRDVPWGAYLAADERTLEVVGTCAFKDAPSDAMVEIAYFTLPSYERRGYGTAMARALISIASASPLVRRVIAHTLPEENASTAILRKVGMEFGGDVQDPEDGHVWRWQIETGV